MAVTRVFVSANCQGWLVAVRLCVVKPTALDCMRLNSVLLGYEKLSLDPFSSLSLHLAPVPSIP